MFVNKKTTVVLQPPKISFQEKFVLKKRTVSEQLPPKEASPKELIIIEANIITIMKLRRTATYTKLINECIEKIKFFKAEPLMIKPRIESLIEREYLKRD
jgi:cullin 1